jgi:flagellar basal-body rod modification protein FlgD
MDGILQNRLNPVQPKATQDFSDATVKKLNADVVDSTDKDKTSFKDLMSNSNTDQIRSREAQKNGDGVKLAKTNEEFAQAMLDKANKDNLRKPQNELDKDAFLKLFITQMQNQDPLNPDNSSEMASQLAQFHGLEQMLNVNKNLEKMQADNQMSRAVGLINFVGKDLKLESGKLKLENGKLSDAMLKTDVDVPSLMVEVRDAAGVVVHSMEVGNVKAGENKLEWNGLGKDGKRVPDGVYTFSAFGKDEQGNDIPGKIISTVKVTGVDLMDAGGSFYTNIGKIRINEVASVGDAGAFGKTAKTPNPNDQAAAAAQAVKDGIAPAGEAGEQAGQQGADEMPQVPADVLEQMKAAAAQAPQQPRQAAEAGPGQVNPAAPAQEAEHPLAQVMDFPAPGMGVPGMTR